MQKDSKILDDIARIGSSALGSLVDMRREVEAMVSSQLEKLLIKMKLVTREEHEVVREMALKAREENENLRKKLAEMEERLNSHTRK